MADKSSGLVDDVLAPRNLILPQISGGNLVAPPKGFICVSGAKIVFYNGSAFETVTSS